MPCPESGLDDLAWPDGPSEYGTLAIRAKIAHT